MSLGRVPYERRFFMQFVRSDNPSDCWTWVGAINSNGYGQLNGPLGNRIYAHRASYEMFIGPIPKGLFVLHHCDNRKCINPSHLFIGTLKDNTQDAISKGRFHLPSPPTHCRKGHLFTVDTIVYKSKGRHCRICRDIYNRNYRNKRRQNEQ